MKTLVLRLDLPRAVGCVIDMVVLYAAMALGMGFLRGRLLSFACAFIATFLLSRRRGGVEPLTMAFGVALNLAAYWLVLKATPHFPALFALAVAAGWLASLLPDLANAGWRRFAHWRERNEVAWPRIELTTTRCLIGVQVVFWTSHLSAMALPGLYMDAVNPDYLAASVLNPGLPNWVATQPTLGLPVLGSLYHGVQNFYVGLPVFALLGFNMLALRVAQGLFAGGILVMTQLMLQRATGSLALALVGALGVATELAFIASFRTQMYIVMSGMFWLLLAIHLALGHGTSAAILREWSMSRRKLKEFLTNRWVLSGLCAGLAAYSYFVYLFFVPVFVALGWWHTRDWRAVLTWLLGFVLGMQTYVLGYMLAMAALGGPMATLEWIASVIQGLEPMSSAQTLAQRVTNAWDVALLTLQNGGNELVIFSTTELSRWTAWKVRLLVAVPLLLAACGLARNWKRRDQPEAGPRAQSFLASWHVALLPIVFFAVSLIFGNRLWSHHFSPLIPLAYVILVIAVHQLRGVMGRSLPKGASAAVVLGFVIGNMHQQHVFFERLEATGGVKYFSNAINRMAEDALSMPADVVHVFPEWGFFMPFALLTGNHRRYEVGIDDDNLQRLAESGSSLRLYYWQPETQSTYRDKLVRHGYQISNSGTYLQRDQGIAFYWIEAFAPDGTK